MTAEPLRAKAHPTANLLDERSLNSILLLGGESTGQPSGTIEDFVRGMGAGPNIRGALVGRNVLFCGDDDPAAIAEAINQVVHQRSSAIEAMEQARKIRGTLMDVFG